MADNQTTSRPNTLEAKQSNGEKASNQSVEEKKLDLATVKSRHDATCKNKSVEWIHIVERCSKTYRTAESYAEFMAATKPRQDEIKDVGGFIGGYCANGSRKRSAVAHRSLITLDADFATQDFWPKVCSALEGFAVIIYSTHKSSNEKPRYRVVGPMDRPVSPDEYEAIARKIAGKIGIDQFDPTSYQVNRIMYWASTSQDGDFVFLEQKGGFINPDEVLSQYHNWQDTSEWPVSDSETAAIKTGIKRQEDPTEKPGVVGAFCRVYGIDEAIETFLSDIYEPCDIPNRYTYKGGTTAAGLIVYENKWAYSHHSTDPTSGKLCNAFDLVRIHKFGHLDEC